LDNHLRNLGGRQCPGCPKVVPQCSADWKIFGQMTLKGEELWEMPFPDPAK